MIKSIAIAILLGISANVSAQSRIYLQGGITTSLGGSFTTVLANHPPSFYADLEWEHKMAGSISFLTGLSYFNVGYTAEESSFGSQSAFDANYIGVPLMARWNMGNRNLGYLDFGFLPYYLTSAHLQESMDKFGIIRTAEGDITEYSKRLFVGAKFQYSLTFNRAIISLFMILPFNGQQSIKNLEDHWAFNQQQSSYLLSNGYSDFFIFGLKGGIRLK